MPTTREDLSERRCRWLRSSGASRSCSLQEPQIERREHQDNPDVYHQALPEPMPEEQDVHADHDGYQREHVKHDGCLSSHRSFLLCATELSKSGAGFSETLALAEPFDALFSRGAPRLRVTNPHWRGFQAGRKGEVAGGAVRSGSAGVACLLVNVWRR